MGVRNSSASTKTPLNQPIVTTAETICFTTGIIGLPLDNALVLITWEVVVTLTGSTTAITARLRRGATTTDTLVNVAQAVNAAANTTVKLAGCYQDTPGVVAGVVYSLTLTMTAAAANSTVNDGCLAAFIL